MRHPFRSDRGTIIIIVVICTMIIAGMSAALLTVATSESDAVAVDRQRLEALELAESAMAQARATLEAATGANSDAVAASLSQAGNVANAVQWDTSTNTWVSVGGTYPTWSGSTNDNGISRSGSAQYTWGAGDGFPTAPDPLRGLPGESGFYAYRLGGANDDRLWTIHCQWWGSDGVDNNTDGTVDTDTYEQRTYTVRAVGIYGDSVVELETVLTRDPPTPAIDPNTPPAGFLAAISIQVSAGSGAPAGTVNIKNNSAANSIDGHDNATSITGADAPSSSNDTHGVLLAASGSSLTLSSNNNSGVTGSTGSPSFNNNGAFIGDIIDTIADGAKGVAVNSSTGAPSDDATNQDWGNASNLKIVYHNFDTHGSLAVSNPGFGILVVDATTLTSTPAVTFSGSGSTWEGIVIVRVKNNLSPSGPNGAIKATGAGSSASNTGSMVVYAKQSANFSGGDVYKNNGNRPTRFSMGAVKKALEAFNTAVPPSTTGEVGTPLVWRPIRQPGMAWASE